VLPLYPRKARKNLIIGVVDGWRERESWDAAEQHSDWEIKVMLCQKKVARPLIHGSG
jgi:hypothetical protein